MLLGFGDKYYSALEYAYKLYVVIYGIFSYAIGNIIFPELSRAISSNDTKGYISTISKSIRIIAFLLIPLTFGFLIYSKDVVSISYERGQFTSESTSLTSQALFCYAIGIVGAGLVEIMNKAFYAKQDIKTPLCVGSFIVLLNVLLCFLLSKSVLSYSGIALATAIVALINGTVLSFLISRKSKGIFNKALFIDIFKILICSVIMSVTVILVNYLFKDFSGDMIKNLIKCGVGCAVGVIVYFILSYLLGVNQFFVKKVNEK